MELASRLGSSGLDRAAVVASDVPRPTAAEGRQNGAGVAAGVIGARARPLSNRATSRGRLRLKGVMMELASRLGSSELDRAAVVSSDVPRPAAAKERQDGADIAAAMTGLDPGGLGSSGSNPAVTGRMSPGESEPSPVRSAQPGRSSQRSPGRTSLPPPPSREGEVPGRAHGWGISFLPGPARAARCLRPATDSP